MGLDIECYINKQRYYIGWSHGKRVVAKCPDGKGVHFETLEDMLEYIVEGKKLKDSWEDIQIRSM